MDRQPGVKNMECHVSTTSLTFSRGEIKKTTLLSEKICIKYTLFYIAQHDNRSRSIYQIKQNIEHNLTINNTNKMHIYKHTYVYELSTVITD